MKLAYEILSKALYELEFTLGHGEAWAMMTEESGVYNVKYMAEGRVKPTIESWQQLHKTFPDKIPPPKMLDNVKVEAH